MFNDITKPPPPLPVIQLEKVSDGVHLLHPLSRRGHGPGLIILVPNHAKQVAIESGVPSALIKWAEEGYAVVEIQHGALTTRAQGAVREAIEALARCENCESTAKTGLIAYGAQLWNDTAPILSQFPNIVAAVLYADAADASSIASADTVAAVHHFAGSATGRPRKTSLLTEYYYPAVASYRFAIPFGDEFHYTTEAVSHTRNLTLLKRIMGGPYFDLETIWEEHTYYEFADRSVEHTMSTMVQEPYVNHVPTLTGGIGRGPLTSFYRDHFIFNNSADTDLELVSRTVGIDRVVDEFIFKFTHDQEVDWMLPGVPPTGLKVEVPFTAVVNIRGDRLYHEHINWDQGTLLKQLGLLPEYLPFPYSLPDANGEPTSSRPQVEFRLPVLGKVTAEKLRDRDCVPSNEVFAYEIRK